MATWIKTNEAIAVEPKNGKDFKLDELQKFVGGYIEIVQLNRDMIMVCNEEGKLMGLPFNPTASILLMTARRNDYIAGDVLVCKSSEVL